MIYMYKNLKNFFIIVLVFIVIIVVLRSSLFYLPFSHNFTTSPVTNSELDEFHLRTLQNSVILLQDTIINIDDRTELDEINSIITSQIPPEETYTTDVSGMSQLIQEPSSGREVLKRILFFLLCSVLGYLFFIPLATSMFDVEQAQAIVLRNLDLVSKDPLAISIIYLSLGELGYLE